MGLKVKDASLQNRESRRSLKVRNEPYWRAISQGLHVGYRKGTLKRAWLVRRFTDGRYVWRTLGQVDEVLDADGKEVLNWAQAQEAAQAFDKDLKVPHLPTLIEAGVKGYDATNWGGILAPAGTPRAIIERLNTALNQGLARAEVRERMISLGAEPVTGTPEELGELVKRELARNGKIIQNAGLRAE